MPLPLAAKAGFIAISVAVVAAIAVYESPEIRRMADDLRRRIAIAMQSINDSMNGEESTNEQQRQQEGEPIFNRPEDAEGFMMSRGRRSAEDPGVVADEESRRRQREELMYWNRMQMERKKEEERKAKEAARTQARGESSSASSSNPWQPREALESLQRATRDAAAAAGIYLPSLGGPQSQPRSKTSFDQFMRPDHNADRGTFVVNTGADTMSHSQVSEDPLNSGLLRRRRPEGVRGLHTAAVYANPFGDEYGIELDDHDDHHTTTSTSGTERPTAAEAFNSGTAYLIAPDRDETMSDIYSATEPDTNGPAANNNNNNNNNNNSMDAVFDPLPAIPEAQQAGSYAPTSEVFFDVNDYAHEAAEASPATLAAAEVDSQLSLRLFRKEEDNDNDDDVVLPGGEEQNQEANQVNTEAYNSIQAWAQNSSRLPGFYSPLPVTPSVGMSEPSVISGGEMTPTGSMSVWGDDHSVIDHADADAHTDAGSEIVQVQAQVEAAPSVPSTTPSSAVSVANVANSDYGVISEADDDDNDNENESEGVMTPTSWSEVGSVVSESDAGMHAVHS